MPRTSEAQAHRLMAAAAECGETVVLPVAVARDLAADVLEAYRRQRAIDDAVDRLEEQMTKGRAA